MSFTENIQNRIDQWLNGPFDEESKNEIRKGIQENPEAIADAFYTDLDFGTGGLRGIMGTGPNRMNKYTVGMATQGLANYILSFKKDSIHSVAIAFDNRNNSVYFAQISADVLSANGIKVFLFDKLRPTPELSFAVREYNCSAGIVITASHNPKEYNGYKVYWNDGGQLISPHDKNVIDNVRKIQGPAEVLFDAKTDLIKIIGKETDESYLKALMQVKISEKDIEAQQNMGIVYTPLHGTGVEILPAALKRFGFKNIINVPEQDISDGNFPSVISPNPEEKAAWEMAIEKAKESNASLVLATDPDADRLGVGIRMNDGTYKLLNGNQTACILAYYTLKQKDSKGEIPNNAFMVKTIVSTDLFSDIAESYNVKTYEVLTGFKYIAALIREKEGLEKYLGGGEESYGYLGADFIRDKDAVMTACQIAEIAAWAANRDMTLYDILEEIYKKHGYYTESLLSLTKKGITGKEEITKLMEKFRNNPPKSIVGSDIIMIKDYLSSVSRNVKDAFDEKIDLPKSNVLQFILKDKSKITIRPSGTEPKIKFYCSLYFNDYSIESINIAKRRLDDIQTYFKN